jgi:DNA polymerase III alpha subunit
LKFVNLHGHDGFSLYDGYGSPETHYEACIENAGDTSMGMAITNHGTCNSIGYIAALQKKIKNKGISAISSNIPKTLVLKIISKSRYI